MPDIVVEYFKPGEKESDLPIREKDLIGHIKSDDEKAAKPEDNKKIIEKIKDPQVVLLKREYDDVSKDNQLKSAVDLLKSWKLFNKKRAA